MPGSSEGRRGWTGGRADVWACIWACICQVWVVELTTTDRTLIATTCILCPADVYCVAHISSCVYAELWVHVLCCVSTWLWGGCRQYGHV